jgi:hypothetical protein
MEFRLLNWKQLLVYFILLENKLPTNAQIETYQNLLKQEINDYDEIPSHKFLEVIKIDFVNSVDKTMV